MRANMGNMDPAAIDYVDEHGRPARDLADAVIMQTGEDE
jgi:hypothetical protein